MEMNYETLIIIFVTALLILAVLCIILMIFELVTGIAEKARLRKEKNPSLKIKKDKEDSKALKE